LALYAALKIQENDKRGKVIYLDFNHVQQPDADFSHIEQFFKLRKDDMLIVDNWHSRPDCRDELNEYAKSAWKDVAFLYLWTRFKGDVDEQATPAIPLEDTSSEVRPDPVDTERFLQELAGAMVKNHVDHYREKEPAAELKTDAGDSEQALEPPIVDKRMRGNLRYLRWRLDAWDPRVCRLRDLGTQEMSEAIRRNLVEPADGHWIGDLLKVAVLAQWEVPYLLAPAENPPEGFSVLQAKNLITKSEDGTTWYMDSTDAYLALKYRWKEEWLQNTESELKKYLEQSPDQVPIALRRIMTQAEKDTKRRLLVGLLQSPIILGEQKRFLLQRVRQGNLGVSTVYNMANTLLGDIPEDDTEKQKRIKVARELFSKEVGEAVGEAARGANLQRTMWLLMLLKRDPEASQPFVIAFLGSFGQARLRTRI
jgi:hypothetical protein